MGRIFSEMARDVKLVKWEMAAHLFALENDVKTMDVASLIFKMYFKGSEDFYFFVHISFIPDLKDDLFTH